MSDASGFAGPDELVAALFSYLERAKYDIATPHSKILITKLVREAFRASLCSEEGRAVTLQLFFDLGPSQVTLPFDTPLAYTADNLVKLAPIVGLGFRWIVVARDSEEVETQLKIFGLCDPALSPPVGCGYERAALGVYVSDLPGLRLSILSPGWLRLETWGGAAFDLQNCRTNQPWTINILPSVRAWYEQAATSLFKVGSAQMGCAIELIGRILVNVLRKVCDARHGGTLIVVPDENQIPDRLRIRFRAPSELPRTLVKRRITAEFPSNEGSQDEPANEDVHSIEREIARMSDMVAALTSVDGAVVLHRDLRIIGFGAEIIQTGSEPPSNSLEHRGMRHRSAARFCANVAQSLVFVVSQDGGVRLLFNDSGESKWEDVATPEHWWVLPHAEKSL